MTTHFISLSKTILFDFLVSFFWFPVWWYTRGLKKITKAALAELDYRYRSYGFKIWIKNFFVPMYGYYDWMSRIVSVFMRFFVLVGRIIALVCIAAVYVLGIIIWLIAPPVFLILAVTNGVKGTALSQIGL